MAKPLSLLITRFPYESVLSGEEWHTITLAEKLRKRGHQVAFFGSCKVLATELEKRGFPVRRSGSGPVPVSGRGVLGFALLAPGLSMIWAVQLVLLCIRHRLSTIYMHSLSEKLLLTPWALLLGRRVIWVEHQRWGRWMFGNPLRFPYRFLARFVRIIGVSPQYQESFARLGVPMDRTDCIPNGIDLEEFSPTVSPLPLGAEALHVGCMARLSVDKGVDLLLEAFATMDSTALSCPVHLHLIGEGPLKEQLETRIKDLGLTARVHMYVPYRTIPRSDTPRFMKALDVFVLPSALPDPFGLVAAESMAVGTATIVSDICGIHSFLRKNTDFISVPAGNIPALAQAMTRILADPEGRASIAKEGAATARAQFSLDTMVDRYLAVFTR